MKKMLLGSVIVAALLTYGAVPAWALYDWMPGSSCQPKFPSTSSYTYVDKWGFHNGDYSNDLYIDCPAHLSNTGGSSTGVSISVPYVYFKYTDNSSTAIQCSAYARDSSYGSDEINGWYATGSLYTTPSVSGSYGNCATSNSYPGYTGNGTCYWPNPFNGGYAFTTDGRISIECIIPRTTGSDSYLLNWFYAH
ncbi:MAG TPA: hypothetical protein VGQ83_36415 [Polyangia bacterium]|jgi:hypothetical protein